MSSCAAGYERDWIEESFCDMDIVEATSLLTEVCHKENSRWWKDLETGQSINRNVGELIALVHSEMSEALEAHRKGLMDDKLPHRSGVEVELADALIRIFDMAGGLQLDVAGALQEKLAYNRGRRDHTPEARREQGGKRY
jgi:NTP pyrophosphatase (non-canonical NTP hydrolase)